MLPSAQSIIIELGCLDICNRNMRKFVVKYNQMECSCKLTSCFVNKMYYFGLLAFRLYTEVINFSSQPPSPLPPADRGQPKWDLKCSLQIGMIMIPKFPEEVLVSSQHKLKFL